MSTRYPMEVWIGSERYEIRTGEELELALRDIDTRNGSVVFNFTQDLRADLLALLFSRFEALLRQARIPIVPGSENVPETGKGAGFSAMYEKPDCCKPCTGCRRCPSCDCRGCPDGVCNCTQCPGGLTPRCDRASWVQISTYEEVPCRAEQRLPTGVTLPHITSTDELISLYTDNSTRNFIRRKRLAFWFLTDKAGRKYFFNHRWKATESQSIPASTPASILASCLNGVCDDWGKLIDCYKQLLAEAEQKILISHGLNYRDFIRSLVNIASLASRLKTAQREQLQSTRQLAKDFDMKWGQRLGIEDEAYEREEDEIFDVESQSKPHRPNRSYRYIHPNTNYYRPSRTNPLLGWLPVRVSRKRRRHERKAPQAEREVGDDLMRAMERLAGVSNALEDGLVKEIDALFQRASNIASIDEAYKAREQNSSMKRLSWITFIFLPLLFVASLYGMNVDVLANDPRWTTYFIIAVPVFAVVMTVVVILKHQQAIAGGSPGVTAGLLKLIRRSRRKSKIYDEECQISPSMVDRRYNKAFVDAILTENNAIVKHLLSLGIVDANFYDGKMTGLQYSAAAGNEDLVHYLLENGADVNAEAVDDQGRTALQAASEGGHLAVVDRLLEKGANVNAQAGYNQGRTALQAASAGGHLAVVDRLLEKGANVNEVAVEYCGRTALQAASAGGHLAVVDRLLERGANVNAEAGRVDGRTALQSASAGGHLAVVDRLLEKGANVNAEAARKGGRTALQSASEGGHLAVVDRLLEEGANVNSEAGEYHGRTALQAASEGGHLSVVDRLMEKGAYVNAEAARCGGRTALQAASEGGHLAVVQRLLEKGADINGEAGYDHGRTALQSASEGGHLAVVDRLLERGANINAEAGRVDGRTALQSASEGGHLAVVDRLLEKGANVNAEAARKGGRTALQAASEGGHLSVVDRLLERGANVNADAVEHRGRTALQSASEGGHLSVVDRLLEMGANVNAEGGRSGGRTALRAASERGHLSVVDRLLENGANVNAEAGRYVRTVLQAASDKGHFAVVERLRRAGATR